MQPHTVYSPADRPDAEVEVDGTWYAAEIRMWLRDDDGSWHAQASWTKSPGMGYISTFPAARVRQPAEDPRTPPA